MGGSQERAVDGRQLRWEQHKAARREQIISAALDLIEQQPGEPPHVQQIADRAGLNRSAVHRLFRDRHDLDRAIQTEVCDRGMAVLFENVTFDLDARSLVHAIVQNFVQWVMAHPAWVTFAEQSVPGSGMSPLDRALQEASSQFQALISAAASGLGTELDDDDREVVDAWVFGFVRGGLAAVQRWISHPAPSRPQLIVGLVSDMIWYQISGAAAARQIVIPDGPLDVVMSDRLGD